MSPETTSTKLCPTCGTRLSEGATRCTVCGAEVESVAKSAKKQRGLQGSRMPEVTLSLPAAIGLLALFLVIGAGMVFLAVRRQPKIAQIVVPPQGTNTPQPTATLTPTLTPTPSPLVPPTLTHTPEPTSTPIQYIVQAGQTCSAIAAFFNVSVTSIVALNNLSTTCALREGQPLLIPQPTPTPTGQPTATLSEAEKTRAACETVSYTVQDLDTLMSISQNYSVPMESIRTYNGLPGNTVYLGTTLIIPLCERYATPGPTPTPTLPPPYPAPNLLLPANGAPFTLADDTITLQWASVGTIRENENYMVKVEDLTDSKVTALISYVPDTKFIVPGTFRPKDNAAHIMSWTVVVVRPNGTDENGKTIWVSAGAVSVARLFSWTGVAPASTPSP